MSNCQYPNCDLEIDDSNNQKCILHCSKDDWFTTDKDDKIKWDEKRVTEFWKRLNSYIKPYYLKSSLNQKIVSPILNEITSFGNGTSKKHITIKNIIIPSLNSIDNLDNSLKYYYFDNCIFIGDFIIDLKLKDNHLKIDLDFSQSIFKGKFIIKSDSAGIDGNIKISGTKHFDDISFEGDYFKSIHINNINHNVHHNKKININFTPSLILRHMTFESLIFTYLDKSMIENIFIGYANINNLFIGKTFKGLFELNSFKIKNSIINKCDISNLNTEKFVFEDISFKDNSQVNLINIETDNLIINGLYQNSEYINLNQIKVHSKFKCNKADFHNVIFENFDISEAEIKEISNTSFTDSHQNSIKWGNINKINSSRDIFRQLKSLNDEKSNYMDANNFFVKEMKEYKNELDIHSWFSNWWEEKFVFLLNKEISNFGRSWFQSLIWFCLITLIFFNLIEAQEKQYDFSFYIINISFLFLINFSLTKLIRKFKIKIYVIPHIVTLVYLYFLTYGSLNDLSNFINPASYNEYKKDFASLWALHKAILGVIIYHFTISLKRQTKR